MSEKLKQIVQRMSRQELEKVVLDWAAEYPGANGIIDIF